ncbi:MAG: hypothetical protein LBR28_05165, partial [Bacteroidales bacterium]|nr:hypothetical protein [Bacteroidales bacterium]
EVRKKYKYNKKIMKNVFIKATLIVAIISGTIMFNACNEKDENNNTNSQKIESVNFDILTLNQQYSNELLSAFNFLLRSSDIYIVTYLDVKNNECSYSLLDCSSELYSKMTMKFLEKGIGGYNTDNYDDFCKWQKEQLDAGNYVISKFENGIYYGLYIDPFTYQMLVGKHKH